MKTMITWLTAFFVLSISFCSFAQFDILKQVEKKIEKKAEDETDTAIDKAVNKTADAVKMEIKKKIKKTALLKKVQLIPVEKVPVPSRLALMIRARKVI